MFPDKFTSITQVDVEAVYSRNVLSVGVDAKTRKGQSKGYMTGIQYLAPSTIAGVNLCPRASLGCKQACLFSAGRGAFYNVTRQRIIKTLAYLQDKPRYIATLKRSIQQVVNKAIKQGYIPVIRLNGTSDIVWEFNTDVIQSFPNVQFYDYTKISQRFKFSIPKNYHLTFSRSENNEHEALKVLDLGGNVAAVWTGEYPETYLNAKVINGDQTDLRFLDPPKSVVALKAKGQAKRDRSGFVLVYNKGA
jgi:hypothetical protein